MRKLFFKFFLIILTCFLLDTATFSSLFFSSDIDLRYEVKNLKYNEFKIKGIGFSLRKIFADKTADRLILFSVIDIENIKYDLNNNIEFMIDQLYLQYKGPLGRWNVSFGRYILPFGLLSTYSSKRLLVETSEYETIGLETDSGILLSGFIGNFEYAASLSLGVGMQRWVDIDNEQLFVLRCGYQTPEFEDLKAGLSLCSGRVLYEKNHDMEVYMYKKIMAVDLTKYFSGGVLRTEICFGKEDNGQLLSIFSGLDYALMPKLEINLGYSYLEKSYSGINKLILGLSTNIYNFTFRIAQKFSLKKDKNNEFVLQVYKIFNFIF